MKIKQMKALAAINADNTLLPIEKEIAAIKVLRPDLTDDDIERMDFDELKDLSPEFDTEGEIRPTIKVKNKNYTLAGDALDFDFTVGQMKTIQKAMAADPTDYIATMMAVLYDRTGTTLEERIALFEEELEVEDSAPFIGRLNRKFGVPGTSLTDEDIERLGRRGPRNKVRPNLG